VLSGERAVLHAERDAREDSAQRALREAAKRMDQARRPGKGSPPEEALGFWRALVDGRWSLVEHFESDGRRILVARRNAPTSHQHEALSEQERNLVALLALGHSIKLCAYELGRAESTTSELARNALHKMGIRSRAELIELYGAIVSNDHG
jgi:DNA-binding NarL/FixJ family response regulator